MSQSVAPCEIASASGPLWIEAPNGQPRDADGARCTTCRGLAHFKKASPHSVTHSHLSYPTHQMQKTRFIFPIQKVLLENSETQITHLKRKKWKSILSSQNPREHENSQKCQLHNQASEFRFTLQVCVRHSKPQLHFESNIQIRTPTKVTLQLLALLSPPLTQKKPRIGIILIEKKWTHTTQSMTSVLTDKIALWGHYIIRHQSHHILFANHSVHMLGHPFLAFLHNPT